MKLPGDLDLDGGELLAARVERYASLPAFDSSGDHGRLIYVTTGPDVGFHFGGGDGTDAWSKIVTNISVAEYSVTNETIGDGSTFQSTVSPAAGAPQRGIIARVELTASLGSGKVIVQIYEDSGYANRVYRNVFDLADLNADSIPAYYESDVSGADLYVRITNETGSSGDFSVNIKTAAVLPVTTPPPPGAGTGINSGVAGDGIAYDGINTRLDVDLDTNPGLQLLGTAGSRKLSVLIDPTSGLGVGASGINTSGLMDLTSDQQVGGEKEFTDSSLVITPAGTAGPPTSGTWKAGSLYLDSNQSWWFCESAGTPGDWIFWGFEFGTQGGGSTGAYTGTVAAGGSADLVLTLTGRRGMIRKLNVWAAEPTYAPTDIDIPFRVAIFEDENFEGRGMVAEVVGQGRTTYTSGSVLANATTIGLNSVDIANLDDLVRLRDRTSPLEEYARVTVRRTSPVEIDVDENIDNALAANDPVMFVTEFYQIPWWNNSQNAAKFFDLNLRFFNDDASQDVILGYEIWIEEFGGGMAI